MADEKTKIPDYVTAPPAYTAAVTTQPAVGYAPTGPVSVQPPDYLILSIFTIVCCFWPIGIIALIKSVETRNNIQYGRYLEAERSSREAKQFNMIAIGIGIAVNILVWVIVLVSIIPTIAIAAVNSKD